MDAAYINEVAHHESVRPYIGFPAIGHVDLTAMVHDTRNICYRIEHGAFLFLQLDTARYELHTMILPGGRGSRVIPAFQEAARFMFVETDCAELVTKVPGSNKRADMMARRAGFAEVFTRANAWEDGSDVVHFALSLDRWRGLDDEALAAGRAFHTMLEAAKEAAGSPLAAHPDDEAHDRAAGLSCLMACAGNPLKAAWAYSRWARFAGYQTIECISQNPVVIDVRDALVTVRNGKLEVLQCRR